MSAAKILDEAFHPKGGTLSGLPGRWLCPSCGTKNADLRTECRKCGVRSTDTPTHRPSPGSIITLTEEVLDYDGEWLPPGLDVVVLETVEDGSILVNAEREDETSVDAWVHPGEWEQRPEERR